MTQRPAEILGLDTGRLTVGAPADFILIDLDYPWQVKEAELLSRSHNTAFEGARLAGKVVATYVGGERVFDLEGVAA
jgi:dihydroorotase